LIVCLVTYLHRVTAYKVKEAIVILIILLRDYCHSEFCELIRLDWY